MNQFKERRKFIRIPLLATTAMVSDDLGVSWHTVLLHDISAEGAFIKKCFKPRLELLFKIELPSNLGYLQLTGKVMHCVWDKRKERHGSGLQLDVSNPTEKRLWDSWILYRRNLHITTVSKRLLAELGLLARSLV